MEKNPHMSPTFDELVAEAEAVSVDGWDFSWLDGRATEEPTPWGYRAQLEKRLSLVDAALDIQTGGGEVLGGVAELPSLMAATEAWPPNVVRATERLHPRGAVVVVHAPEDPLPFAADAFDLVSSRHPNGLDWQEVARVLRPGGTCLGQHIGSGSLFELGAYFLGPPPEAKNHEEDAGPATTAPEQYDDVWHHRTARRHAQEAGLEVVELRTASLRTEFFDIGALIYFLRKVVWAVPGFSVDRYRDRLRELHEAMRTQGPFVTYATRFLMEARKPS
jgi:SAM-dependent methyltransferase